VKRTKPARRSSAATVESPAGVGRGQNRRRRSLPDRPHSPSRSWAIAVAVAALAATVYSNSLGGALLYDDTNAILSNALVKSGDVIGILTQPSWWGVPRGALWRPITTLTFALDHALHGFTPLGYHAVNVGLHAGVSVLLLVVFGQVTAAPLAAAVAALLFAAHPVHTEAVASVVGRAELLAAGGLFLAWLCFLAADHARWGVPERGRRPMVAAPSRLRRNLLEMAGVVVFFCAMLSKENALVLPLVLVLADLLYPPRGHAAAAVARARAPRVLALVAAAGLFVALRGTMVGFLAQRVDLLDNPLVALAPSAHLMTATKVIGLYAWRLLVPLRLSADYSYQQIAPVTSVVDAQFIGGLVVLLGVPAVGWWARRRAPAVAFAMGFMALTFALVSNLLFPIGTIMGERLLYLPSAGFCLLLGVLLERATTARVRRLVLPLGLVLALYAVRTWTRNVVWHDPLVFFSTMVGDAPRSARSHRELGTVLAAAGRFDESRREFDRALAIKPGDPATLYNLGNALAQAQQVEEAVDAYRRALAAKPDFAEAMENLGNAESLRGDHESALAWMRRALPLRPNSAILHMNIANELFRLGMNEEAHTEYQAALALAPDAPDILINYGAFLYARGQYEAAIAAYQRATTASLSMAYVGLAASYRARGMLPEARAVQARAERLFPRDGAVRQMGEALREGRSSSGEPAGP
jgi:tetratricopeptide (TPR) repeat protein